MPLTDIPKVSYSSKFLYNWCGRQYFYERVAKVKPDFPPRISTIVGKAIHAIVSRMYKEEKFVLDLLIESWPSYFYDYLKRDGFTFSNQETEQRWLNIGEGILRKFYEEASKRGMFVKPVKTEWRGELIVTAKSGRQYRLVFVVDLIVQVGDKLYIIDFKSGSFKLNQAEVDQNDQLTFYSLGVRRVLKIIEDNLGLFYLRYGTILWTTRDEKSFEALVEAIDEDWQKIAAKEFPATYHNCHLCSFSRRCSAEDLSSKTGVSMSWLYSEPK